MSTKLPTPAEDAEGGVSVANSRGFQIGPNNTQNNVGIDATTLPPPQSIGAGAVVHNLPQASAVFVGRDVSVLADQLDGDNEGVVVGQAAVHGLGGIGKSELVNHYARRYLTRYSLVWWITAETVESLGLGLVALTRRLHPAATLADAQSWALGWLQAQTGWLLVLDNVEDVNDISDLLGVVGGRGQVLVTTRRDLGAARWARSGLTPFRLGVLSRRSSVDLLTRLTDRQHDAEAAGRLAGELGDLPLALEQAAAYISQHDGMSFDDYRALLTVEFQRIAADVGQGGRADRSVAAVWTVTMGAIEGANSFAAFLMDVLAWLAPDGLPEDVLAPLAENRVDVDDALAVLASYNMINRSDGRVAVHRLVQSIIRNAAVAEGVHTDLQKMAVSLLATAVPNEHSDDVETWPRWTTLLPHISALVDNVPADHTFETLLWLQGWAASFRQNQGYVVMAVAEFERTAADFQRVFGADDPRTLATRHRLAHAYESAGRFDEALAEHEGVLADYRRVLGEDHPETLMARHGISGAYRAGGRREDALAGLEELLVDRRRVLGDDHPETLITRQNIVRIHQSAQRHDLAMDQVRELVSDYRRIFGEDDLGTLGARSTLADVYGSAGQAERSLKEHQSVLADRIRVQGDSHPDTLETRHRIAHGYRNIGRLDEAIDEHEQVLSEFQRVLGEDHPETQRVRHCTAHAYESAGRIEKAVVAHKRVLEDRIRLFGHGHPKTVQAQKCLESAVQRLAQVTAGPAEGDIG